MCLGMLVLEGPQLHLCEPWQAAPFIHVDGGMIFCTIGHSAKLQAGMDAQTFVCRAPDLLAARFLLQNLQDCSAIANKSFLRLASLAQ